MNESTGKILLKEQLFLVSLWKDLLHSNLSIPKVSKQSCWHGTDYRKLPMRFLKTH